MSRHRPVVEPSKVLQDLETVLARLGVSVRCEAFDPGIFRDLRASGGLCSLHGKHVVVVDSGAPVLDRIAVLARALAQLDTETVFMSPYLRGLIAGHRAEIRSKSAGMGDLQLVGERPKPDNHNG